MRWADSPRASVALFVIAVLESSVFPIPPDALLAALVLGAPRKWLRLAVLCTIGSVAGGVAGYAIGAGLMESAGNAIVHLYGAAGQLEQVQAAYARYDVWIVLAAAFTPIPYKVFTIASGAMGMNLASFVLLSLVGRGARFFLVAGLLRRFGEPLRRTVERYFNLLSIVLFAMIVAGFASLRLLRG